jgi:hypothetical protein
MRNVRALVISILSLIVIAWFDYITGYDMHFFVFYFLPVSIVAWNVGCKSSMAMAVACDIAWYAMDRADGHPYPSPFVAYWNAAIELASFVIIGFVVSKLRLDLDTQRQLNIKLENALGEVTQLQGLLPICASCKRIRDDKGYWEQIGTYVGQRSLAQFTHSICRNVPKNFIRIFRFRHPLRTCL